MTAPTCRLFWLHFSACAAPFSQPNPKISAQRRLNFGLGLAVGADEPHPAEFIRSLAVVDVEHRLTQTRRDRTRGAVSHGPFPLSGDRVPDRDNRAEGATCERLGDAPITAALLPLVERERLLRDRVTEPSRQPQDRVSGDARQQGSTQRRRAEAGAFGGRLHEEQVATARFLDVSTLAGVQPHDVVAIVGRGPSLGDVGAAIVAATLGRTGTARRRTDVLGRYPQS